jgi:hypothetical protein
MSICCCEPRAQEMEFWLPSKLMGPNYEVSDKGRVRSHYYRSRNQTAVISQLMRRRYMSVHNSTATYTVHELVMHAFRGPRPEGMQINHIDGSPRNNRLENLEYCTQSENTKHAYRTGLAKKQKEGKDSPFAKLDDEKVRAIRALAGTVSHAKIAPQFGISPAMVGLIIQRKKWGHVL